MPFVVILSGHLTLAFGTQAKSSALHNPPLYSEQTAPVHRVLYAHQWPLASPFSSSAYPALPKVPTLLPSSLSRKIFIIHRILLSDLFF